MRDDVPARPAPRGRAPLRPVRLVHGADGRRCGARDAPRQRRRKKHGARGPRRGAASRCARSCARRGCSTRLVDALGARVSRGATLVLVFEGAAPRRRATISRAPRRSRRGTARRALGEGRRAHWLAHRYSVSYRQAPVFMAGAFSDTMEVAAPWSRLGELYAACARRSGARLRDGAPVATRTPTAAASTSPSRAARRPWREAEARVRRRLARRARRRDRGRRHALAPPRRRPQQGAEARRRARPRRRRRRTRSAARSIPPAS